MTKPLGYYASAPHGARDADIDVGKAEKLICQILAQVKLIYERYKIDVAFNMPNERLSEYKNYLLEPEWNIYRNISLLNELFDMEEEVRLSTIKRLSHERLTYPPHQQIDSQVLRSRLEVNPSIIYYIVFTGQEAEQVRQKLLSNSVIQTYVVKLGKVFEHYPFLLRSHQVWQERDDHAFTGYYHVVLEALYNNHVATIRCRGEIELFGRNNAEAQWINPGKLVNVWSDLVEIVNRATYYWNL